MRHRTTNKEVTHTALLHHKMLLRGFTIVELLVVIVVIGILAAISIVAFNGVQNKSRVASVTSSLSSAAKTLKLDQTVGSTYPATLAAANNGRGISGGANITYQYDTVSNGTSFCLTATSSTTVYHIDSTMTPIFGACGIHGGPVTDGLLAAWKFNGNANDASGNGRNGTVTNATLTAGKDGTGNGAYNFNGSNASIDFGNSTSFNQPSITFSAWIRPSVVTGSQTIFAKELQYKVRLSTTNIEVLISQNGTGWSTTASTTANITTGSWQYVTVTIDSDTNQVNVYKNAVLLRNFTFTGPITTFNTRNLYIGTYSPTAEMFNGDIDEARVYSRALNAAEVLSIYNGSDV